MTNEESSEGVVVCQERWCKKEIASKVIGVVVRFLLLVVIAIPSKAFVRCPRGAKLVKVGELFVSCRDQQQ